MVIGCGLVAVGLVLPPDVIVNACLPGEGLAFAEKLVAGLWCMKAAFLLNGSLLL